MDYCELDVLFVTRDTEADTDRVERRPHVHERRAFGDERELNPPLPSARGDDRLIDDRCDVPIWPFGHPNAGVVLIDRTLRLRLFGKDEEVVLAGDDESGRNFDRQRAGRFDVDELVQLFWITKRDPR